MRRSAGLTKTMTPRRGLRIRLALRATGAAAVAASVLGGPTAVPANAAGSANAWPARGHDTGASFWNPAESTVTPLHVKTLVLSHVIPTAPTQDCLFPIAPVEAGGLLFETGGDGISAYNQWTGHRVWVHHLPAALQSFTTVALQVVGAELVASFTYCESVTSSVSELFFLNVSTGQQDRKPWLTFGGASSVVVHRGYVVTHEFSNDTEWIAGYTMWGRRLWSLDSTAGLELGQQPLLVGNGLLYTTTADRGPIAVKVRDGSVAWASYVSADQIGSLSQDGKDLYVIQSGGLGLLSLNPLSGQVSDLYVPGRGNVLMAVDATTIYTACAGTALCATRRSDGSSIWTVETGGSGQPIVAAGVVYFAGKAFRATTGQRIKTAADGAVVSSVSGGRVYALTSKGVAIYR